jgi:hypothetical protein
VVKEYEALPLTILNPLFHHLTYSFTLKMEASCFYGTLVQITWQHSPQDNNLHSHCSENLPSQNLAQNSNDHGLCGADKSNRSRWFAAKILIMVYHVQLSAPRFYYPTFQKGKGTYNFFILYVYMSACVYLYACSICVCVSVCSTCLSACVCPCVHMRLACTLLTAPTVQKEALIRIWRINIIK